jgi:hypothetical protein
VTVYREERLSVITERSNETLIPEAVRLMRWSTSRKNEN